MNQTTAPLHPASTRLHSYHRWSGPALIVLANVVMLLWFWGRAPDPIIDFGRELYMPWRITEGQQLYRDFTYFNGPFSPYFNALAFKLFGVSLQTLTILNVVLAMGLTALLYRFLVALGDRWSATIALILMPSVFTFAQLNGVPNFNWITPYSHDLTHGILLGFGMIGALWMYVRSRRLGWITLAGVLLGLAFLTKAEVFLASLLAAAAGVGLAMGSDEDRKRRWTALAAFASALVIVVVLAFFLLRLILPTRDVLLALAGSWRWLGNQQLLNLRYFRLINGTDDLVASLSTTLLWAASYATIFGLILLAAVKVRGSVRQRQAIAIAAGAIIFLGLWFFWLRIEWRNFIRPVQLFMAVGGLCLIWRIVRARKDRLSLAELALPMMLTVFAGVLLGKIVWNVRPLHYGFALAMPATLLSINAIVYAGARIARSRNGSPELFRSVCFAMILVATWAHMTIDASFMRKKEYVVGTGGDAFLADIRGKMINEAAEFLLENTRPDQTVVAMPEGFLLNYLARRVNPTIYHQFTPPNLIMYGEDDILATLKAHPPDVVALVHVDNVEYDARFLGKNYGLEIWDWVFSNYEPMLQRNGETALFGYPPFVDQRSGVLLVQRRKTPSQSAQSR